MFEQIKPLPESSQPKRPNYRPILITLLCAFVLGGGSCFGSLAFEDTNPSMGTIFAMAFFCGAIVFIGALIWLVAAWLRQGAK
jgi:hypothetical protein